MGLNMKISYIFDPVPKHMGLRGDSILWKMMTKLCFYENIIEQLKEFFLTIVGTFEGDDVFVPALQMDSGLSNGMVSIKWWRENGFPLLEKRLNKYLEGEMSYKKYWNEQVELQLNWRKKQNNLSEEYGIQNGNKYPHILPKNEWIKTVWDQFSNELLSYLQREKIQHHTGSHNLLSSWVLCSNLYFGTIINNDQKELFRQYLESKLGIKIDSIKNIHLEFVLSEKLSPKILLGEPGGIRGTRQTTPDLAIEFTSNGNEGLVLVECKYTEHSFYDCPAKRNNKESSHICFNRMGFSEKCIQNEWGRKYWEYINISEYGENLKYCPAYIGGVSNLSSTGTCRRNKKVW